MKRVLQMVMLLGLVSSQLVAQKQVPTTAKTEPVAIEEIKTAAQASAEKEAEKTPKTLYQKIEAFVKEHRLLTAAAATGTAIIIAYLANNAYKGSIASKDEKKFNDLKQQEKDVAAGKQGVKPLTDEQKNELKEHRKNKADEKIRRAAINVKKKLERCVKAAYDFEKACTALAEKANNEEFRAQVAASDVDFDEVERLLELANPRWFRDIPAAGKRQAPINQQNVAPQRVEPVQEPVQEAPLQAANLAQNQGLKKDAADALMAEFLRTMPQAPQGHGGDAAPQAPQGHGGDAAVIEEVLPVVENQSKFKKITIDEYQKVGFNKENQKFFVRPERFMPLEVELHGRIIIRNTLTGNLSICTQEYFDTSDMYGLKDYYKEVTLEEVIAGFPLVGQPQAPINQQNVAQQSVEPVQEAPL